MLEWSCSPNSVSGDNTGAQVRELEVELAAQDAAFWEAEERAVAAEDAEEHMAAIEWRTKQAEAARARDAAADALKQVCKTTCVWTAGSNACPTADRV